MTLEMSDRFATELSKQNRIINFNVSTKLYSEILLKCEIIVLCNTKILYCNH